MDSKEVNRMAGDPFFEKTLATLPEALAITLRQLPPQRQGLVQEIRLRLGKPLSVVMQGESWFLSREGRASQQPPIPGYLITRELLEESFLRLCGYSVHSHQAELAQGFVTTSRGDRAGICGTPDCRDITSLSLRVSRELPGCAEPLLRQLDPRQGILLAGMPGSGKTTLLRDLVRCMASGVEGFYYKVAVVDERYELSAAGQGVPLYDLGVCSDLLCGRPKAEAIQQAVRTLSPDIIACDEIGSAAEVDQLEAGLYSGVAFVSTVHCGSLVEALASQRVGRLMDTGAFHSLVLLDSARFPGRAVHILTKEVYDHEANRSFVAL